MNHDDLGIYEEAMKLWGVAAQRLMLIEECGELIAAMSQWWRGRKTDDDLIEEMVDVQLMINQIRVLINDESKWERTFSCKISRLRDLIEKDKPSLRVSRE